MKASLLTNQRGYSVVIVRLVNAPRKHSEYQNRYVGYLMYYEGLKSILVRFCRLVKIILGTEFGKLISTGYTSAPSLLALRFLTVEYLLSARLAVSGRVQGPKAFTWFTSLEPIRPISRKPKRMSPIAIASRLRQSSGSGHSPGEQYSPIWNDQIGTVLQNHQPSPHKSIRVAVPRSLHQRQIFIWPP